MIRIWIILMAGTSAIFLFFFGQAAYGSWVYSRLQQETPAEINRWQIHEISASAYTLIATYTYNVNGKEYKGKTKFKKPYFLNRPSAESALRKWRFYPWKAFYQKSHPEFSSLQKIFPLKHLLYALLSLGVLIYFFFVKKFFQQDLSRS